VTVVGRPRNVILAEPALKIGAQRRSGSGCDMDVAVAAACRGSSAPKPGARAGKVVSEQGRFVSNAQNVAVSEMLGSQQALYDSTSIPALRDLHRSPPLVQTPNKLIHGAHC
jgi:arginine decarboxylase-like protein